MTLGSTDILPSLHWSSDGRSINWVDAKGGRVIDVASGRAGDLPAAMTGCDDLAWQPQP